MNQKARQKYEVLSGVLQNVLSISPDRFGLVLDLEGWVSFSQLLAALHEEQEWRGVRESQIKDLTWALEDCPFEIDGKMIRVAPAYLPAQGLVLREYLPPPVLLYLAVRRRTYPALLNREFSFPDQREIVLAREASMAQRIGRRRDPKPVMVEVNTEVLKQHHVEMLAYGQALFLLGRLVPEALSGPPLKEEDKPPVRKASKPAKPNEPTPVQPRANQPNVPRAWDPAQDRLLARDPSDDERKQIKRQRDRKRVGWKDAQRRDSRRSS